MKFIFEVRIRPGHTAEQYADAWLRASRIIQRTPGARGTRLHRKIGRSDALIAIATWDSKEARDAADLTLRHDPELRQILSEASAHAEITIVGEFEEPEWVVLPDAASWRSPGLHPAGRIMSMTRASLARLRTNEREEVDQERQEEREE